VATEAVKDGRTRWSCICKCMPVRPTVILKDDGQLTKGSEEVLDHWYQHFNRVLNVESIYDVEVVEDMTAVEPMLHHDDPPTVDELETTLSRLKTRKAGGTS